MEDRVRQSRYLSYNQCEAAVRRITRTSIRTQGEMVWCVRFMVCWPETQKKRIKEERKLARLSSHGSSHEIEHEEQSVNSFTCMAKMRGKRKQHVSGSRHDPTEPWFDAKLKRFNELHPASKLELASQCTVITHNTANEACRWRQPCKLVKVFPKWVSPNLKACCVCQAR